MRLKQYIRYHVIFLLFAAAFSVYGFISIIVLKNQAYHCLMHDVLHLYCPLCGGTRAFLSCLRFDLLGAVRYNPAVMLAALVFIVLDIRALILILRGSDRTLFPHWLLPAAICYFAVFTALRNALAFFGVDPVGDVAPFWTERMTTVTASLAAALLLALALFLCGAICCPQKKIRHASAFLTGVFAVVLVSFLYTPLLLLLLAPVFMCFFLWHRYKKSLFSLTAIKYGETTIPLRMAFRDKAGCEERVPISLTLYLIETRGRKILVDAGCDTMPGYDVKHHISPATALRRYGVSPLEITDLVLTHAHNDHAGAAHYFKKATVHIARGELERAIKKGYLTDALNVSPFDTAREIAGVTVKVWGGHSEASSIVTFLHNGREYVIAGDECYQRECLTEKRPTGSSFNKEKSLAFVETFSSDAYTVLMSHDPAILPGQNGYLKII